MSALFNNNLIRIALFLFFILIYCQIANAQVADSTKQKDHPIIRLASTQSTTVSNQGANGMKSSSSSNISGFYVGYGNTDEHYFGWCYKKINLYLSKDKEAGVMAEQARKAKLGANISWYTFFGASIPGVVMILNRNEGGPANPLIAPTLVVGVGSIITALVLKSHSLTLLKKAVKTYNKNSGYVETDVKDVKKATRDELEETLK